MQAIRSSGTSIEVLLAKALWHRGFRYTKNNSRVTGKPDIVFSRHKVAVFCDSEFFHGKDWDTQKHRIRSNQEFWHRKIERNMQRDAEVNAALREQGWVVLRFWGQDIKKNTELCVRKITEVLMNRQAVKYSDLRKKLKIDAEKK